MVGEPASSLKPRGSIIAVSPGCQVRADMESREGAIVVKMVVIIVDT